MLGNTQNNAVFIGEAGCGKSEIAINLAVKLAREGEKPVHFFDLDQTKPLFRSRNVKTLLEEQGILFHYEEQFYDTPVIVGGVAPALLDTSCYTVLDIGGNANGARVLGGFSQMMNHADTEAFYVLNPYLLWSNDIRAIDATMSAILQISRVREFKILSNPNVGHTTTAEEFLKGNEKVRTMISGYMPVEMACVQDCLYDAVSGKTDMPLFPIHLYLTYPWIEEPAGV